MIVNVREYRRLFSRPVLPVVAQLTKKMSVPGEPVETKMGLLSIKGAATAITFFLGLGMFLMAFASTEWLGLDEGISISLWKSCSKDYKTQVWTCVAWDVLPGELIILVLRVNHVTRFGLTSK